MYKIKSNFVDMEKEQGLIAFEIKYSGTLFFCEAQPILNACKIYFNNRFMAEITYDPSYGWIQLNGIILPSPIIEEIGAHIDGHLD